MASTFVAPAAASRRLLPAVIPGLTLFIDAHASISVPSTEKWSVDSSLFTFGCASTAPSAQGPASILMGSDPERPGSAIIYVGEADDVSKRLRRHLATGDNDFFEQAAVVVASDASLTKAHGRYLEAQLIRAVREAGGVRLFNDKHSDLRGLPEADLVDMDYFLKQLRLILPLLGFDLYRGPPGSADPLGSSTGNDALFAFAPAGASASQWTARTPIRLTAFSAACAAW